MRRLAGLAIGSLLGLAMGCAVGGPDESAPEPWWYGDGSGGADSEGGDTSGAGSTDDSGPATIAASSSSSSGASSSAATSSSATSGGGSSLCDTDPNDSQCIACAKAACCQQVEACLQDTDCGCFANCLNGNNTVVCILQCGLPVQLFDDLLTCAEQGCANECSTI
jgi:hypothetical protein